MEDAAVEKLDANYSLSITAMAPRDCVAQESTKGKKVAFYEMLNPCFLKIHRIRSACFSWQAMTPHVVPSYTPTIYCHNIETYS
jgi:hypothetical protein